MVFSRTAPVQGSTQDAPSPVDFAIRLSHGRNCLGDRRALWKRGGTTQNAARDGKREFGDRGMPLARNSFRRPALQGTAYPSGSWSPLWGEIGADPLCRKIPGTKRRKSCLFRVHKNTPKLVFHKLFFVKKSAKIKLKNRTQYTPPVPPVSNSQTNKKTKSKASWVKSTYLR